MGSNPILPPLKSYIMITDFTKFSKVNPLVLHDYAKCYQNPMILEESRSFSSPIDIFSRLMKNRIIFLGSEIDSEVANIITAQLVYMEATSNETITMYINSPGGSVSAGLAIYDTMQIIKPEIKTVCVGMAASMASVLLTAGSNGERNILPNGLVLIHQPSGGTCGTAADMTIDVNLINKQKERLYKILSKHTGQSVEKIIEDSQRDFWLDAEQALDYGLVDRIVEYTK